MGCDLLQILLFMLSGCVCEDLICSQIYHKPRKVQMDNVQRNVHFFGMKGDLKWLSHVFKLPETYAWWGCAVGSFGMLLALAACLI